MDAFFERLRLAAATIDELLSEAFVGGGDADDDTAARRLAAWRQSAAAGDAALFVRRLGRDGLTLEAVRARLAAARPAAGSPPPPWLADAVWIEAALQGKDAATARPAAAAPRQTYAFEQLLLPLVDAAETRLWASLDAAAAGRLEPSARAALTQSLFAVLSELAAPALYERFAAARNAGEPGYSQFVAAMRGGGIRRLFEAKPVLLRLLAVATRQWIDTSREMLLRLHADMAAIREFFGAGGDARVTAIEGELADPHNGGRSVKLVVFADNRRLLYKPKDLRLDVAWHDLIGRLNGADPPLALTAPRTLYRDGYGWSEFIAHTGCADAAAVARYFRRAGAWLALLHLFAATDMHQENLIAAGEHPVPIDLETILQPTAEEHKSSEPEGAAFDAAMDIVANSVMTVGLMPAYGRSVDNAVFAMGGMAADWGARTIITWTDINADAMRPAKTSLPAEQNTNLPHVGGRYAKFADHIEDFAAGFADYAQFLLRRIRTAGADSLFAGFSAVSVRRVIRPTRFYYMLLRRLKDHRRMDDGAGWSAQADFIARLAEWDRETDPLWPLQRAERAALLALNVPHFITASDGATIADAAGTSVTTAATPGLARARERAQRLDETEIAWQVEIIRENAVSKAATAPPALVRDDGLRGDTETPPDEIFLAEADRIAAELSRRAIRRGSSAAFIGLDWLGDSDVFQLVCLGPDLYNGAAGIALFLAAHAAATGAAASGELARAAVALLRKNLKSRNAPRIARALGIGGASGLGSIVYALTVMADALHDDALRADAAAAARLLTDELIAADRQLDVMGGAAGAILGLLRLYRDSGSGEALGRAVKCGEHLLAQNRVGAAGRRSFVGPAGGHGLNGMSHGAAGFAYALASLAAATARAEFAEAAAECVAFEDASYDTSRHNWPDLRNSETPAWPCQWCHGAPGIGLSRLGMRKHGAANSKLDAALLATDIGNAVTGVTQGPPGALDTLCCGSLGRIEFLSEAASALGRGDLAELAARRLAAVLQRATAAGDYRWNAGKRQFNLGLFRGLSGVGYTAMRQAALRSGTSPPPNVLIWE